MADINGSLPVCPSQSFQVLPFLTNGVLTSIFIIFGLVGTLSTCRSTLSQSRHTRLGKYLVAMYLWDDGLLIASMGFYALIVLIDGTKLWTGHLVYLYIIFNPICHFTFVGTIWIVVTISVERYLALSAPLKHRARGTKGVKWICLGIAVFSVIFSTPTMFELTVERCKSSTGNDTKIIPLLSPTYLRLTQEWQYIYRVGCFGLFVSPLPVLLVLVLNVKTLCIPSSMPVGRKSISGLARVGDKPETNRFRHRERKIALLLSGMMFKFLLCYILATVVNIIEVIQPQVIFSTTYAEVVDVSNLLVIIQSATNWLWFLPRRNRRRGQQDADSLTNRRLSSVPYNSYSTYSSIRKSSDSRLLERRTFLSPPINKKFPSQIEIIDEETTTTLTHDSLLRTRTHSMFNTNSAEALGN